MSEPNTPTLIRETPSSIEVSYSAAGKPHWAIKVYCEAGEEGEATTQALALDTEIRAHFGIDLPEGFGL